MKTNVIIIISLSALVIIGGVLFYIYNLNNPLNKSDNSGLDKIEYAINNKIQTTSCTDTNSCPSGKSCSNGRCVNSTVSNMDAIENAINQRLKK